MASTADSHFHAALTLPLKAVLEGRQVAVAGQDGVILDGGAVSVQISTHNDSNFTSI